MPVVPCATALGLGVQYPLLASGGLPPRLVVSSERSIVDALGLVGAPAVDVDGEQLGRATAELLIEPLERRDAPQDRRCLPVPVRWPSACWSSSP